MNETTLIARIQLLANLVRDTLTGTPDSAGRRRQQRPAEKHEEVRPVRKDFFFYQPVIDQETQQLAGHLADISTGGFKLDSQCPLPVDTDYHLIIGLNNEVAEKPFMTFTARSRWCRVDPLDPYVYNIGFQLVEISPRDLKIFNRMMEKFGRDPGNRHLHPHRSNKW